MRFTSGSRNVMLLNQHAHRSLERSGWRHAWHSIVTQFICSRLRYKAARFTPDGPSDVDQPQRIDIKRCAAEIHLKELRRSPVHKWGWRCDARPFSILQRSVPGRNDYRGREKGLSVVNVGACCWRGSPRGRGNGGRLRSLLYVTMVNDAVRKCVDLPGRSASCQRGSADGQHAHGDQGDCHQLRSDGQTARLRCFQSHKSSLC